MQIQERGLSGKLRALKSHIRPVKLQARSLAMIRVAITSDACRRSGKNRNHSWKPLSPGFYSGTMCGPGNLRMEIVHV
ncbi:MAG: hypothetical protein CL797_10115 [Chromatiales bacterium]|nr:hypothetical protein [Chromatiales bacterium]